MSWGGIIITFALVDNVILSRLLGVRHSVCMPGSMRAAVGTGISTALLMAVSAVVGWALGTLALVPLGFSFLQTPAFVLAVAGLALLLRQAAARVSPAFVKDVSFPEVAVNCATLGVVLITTRGGYTAGESLVAGSAAGLGYFLVTVMMTAIRERLEVEQVPRALRGLPLHLISAGLLAYAFMAFDRAFLARVLGG
ncbi:MAG: Rnf-Nqr domain containing protein [Spirochaetia bacterium]|jgi:electron transport complex protein RnfA